MSTEKLPLQPLVNHAGGEQEAESDPGSLPEKPQEDSSSKEHGDQPLHKTKLERFKGIFITVMVLLGFAIVNAAVSVILPFYPIVSLKHKISPTIVGFVIGMAPLCTVVLSPILGFFLPHLGLKFTQLAGLFLSGGSFLLFSSVTFMPNATLFVVFSFLLRTVEGVGIAMFSTASYTLLTQMYAEKKGTAVGLIVFSVTAGYAIGAPMGGGLQQLGGFKLPFLIIGGFTFIIMVVLFVIVEPRECKSQMLPWKLLLRLFSNLLFLLLVLSITVSMSALTGGSSLYGKFLFLHFKLSVGVIGIIILIVAVTYMIGSMVAGPLADKLHPRLLIIAGLVVAGLGCIFIGPPEFMGPPKLWLSIIASAVIGAGIAFASVPVYSDSYAIAQNMHVVPDDETVSNLLSGIAVATSAAGGFVGPVVAGALASKFHFQAIAAIYGLVLLFYALLLFLATVLYVLCESKCKQKKKKSETAS